MRNLLMLAILIPALFLGGCGTKGDSAAPPASIVAVAGDGVVTVTFATTPGVDYWLSYAPGPTVNCFDIPPVAHYVLVQVGGSPFVIAIANGNTFSFSINGRTNGGPGGPCSAVVTATPRLAGTATPSLPAPWAAQAALGANNMRGVAFGTQFEAVGANGVMYSSTDGIQWTQLNFAVATNLNAVVYGGAYLAVGDGGVILYSTDGTTWTPQNSGTANNLNSVKSNNVNLWVAVGANGTILKSSDGKTWVAVASGTAKDLYAVTYASSGLWLAVGANGTLLTSIDGTTWQAVNSNTALALTGVAFGTNSATGTGIYVAVGANGTLVTSTDGANWTAQPAISVNTLSAVIYATQFIAVGANGTILTSTNGTTWTAQPSTTANNLNAIAQGLYRYSVVGAAGANLLAL